MKAISVKQPWASLIAAGHQTVECRTWKTEYRGQLLICSFSGDFEINDGLIAPGGMALGVVELVDVRRMTKEDLEPSFVPDSEFKNALRGYGWHVKKLYELIPTPINGKMNLFDVDISAFQKLPEGYLDHCVYLDAMEKQSNPQRAS